MRAYLRFLAVVVAGVLVLTGCEQNPDRATPSPSWSRTSPTDGSICGVPGSVWEGYLGDIEIGEFLTTAGDGGMLSVPENRRPDPDNPTPWYWCDVYQGTDWKEYDVARDAIASVKISTKPPGNSLISEANQYIDAAVPEQSFIALGRKGWLYPAEGPTPVYGKESRSQAALEWTCGNTLIDISVRVGEDDTKSFTLPRPETPKLAKAIFDHLVDGVKCDA